MNLFDALNSDETGSGNRPLGKKKTACSNSSLSRSGDRSPPKHPWKETTIRTQISMAQGKTARGVLDSGSRWCGTDLRKRFRGYSFEPRPRVRTNRRRWLQNGQTNIQFSTSEQVTKCPSLFRTLSDPPKRIATHSRIAYSVLRRLSKSCLPPAYGLNPKIQRSSYSYPAAAPLRFNFSCII